MVYLASCILIVTLAAAEPTAADSSADASGSNSTASTTAAPHHKSLMPLAGTDIGLFIVVAVALFIASGAGVGGGERLVHYMQLYNMHTMESTEMQQAQQATPPLMSAVIL